MSRFQNAVYELLQVISESIPDAHKDFPLKAYIAGGVAVNFYTDYRVSEDIDIQFERSIKDLPSDLFINYLSNENKFEELYLDYNYNDTLGLMHEDYPDRAIKYSLINEKFDVYVLSPVDLIISKTLRFQDNDEKDIRELLKRNLVDREKYITLVEDAINVGAGFNIRNAHLNKSLILEIFEEYSCNKTESAKELRELITSESKTKDLEL